MTTFYQTGVVRTIYDPTAGREECSRSLASILTALNPQARLTMFGQELNDESYAICKADMLNKGQDVATLSGATRCRRLATLTRSSITCSPNPPFGVEWKKVEKEIRKENESQGFNGRFCPGLPRVSDGSLLFLLHLLSKNAPSQDGGSRFGIVLNGSPLVPRAARGSGGSEIAATCLESVWSSIIGLPTDMSTTPAFPPKSGLFPP